MIIGQGCIQKDSLNLRYQVEQGHHVLRIVPEDLKCDFFVIAKGIHFEFPKR